MPEVARQHRPLPKIEPPQCWLEDSDQQGVGQVPFQRKRPRLENLETACARSLESPLSESGLADAELSGQKDDRALPARYSFDRLGQTPDLVFAPNQEG